MVTITRSGYIKRTHVEAYRSQRRGGKGVTGMETKEEDIVEDLFVASTHSYLLFFTNSGKIHWLKVHEIPEGGPRGQGQGDGEPPVAGRGRARSPPACRCATSTPAATSSSPPSRAR